MGHGDALGFHGVATAVIHAGIVAWEGEWVGMLCERGRSGRLKRRNCGVLVKINVVDMMETYCHSSKQPFAYA